MLRRLVAVVALGMSLGAGASMLWPSEALAVDASECCKICRKGCACGDSCISCAYECHKSSGCACNERDVDEADEADE